MNRIYGPNSVTINHQPPWFRRFRCGNFDIKNTSRSKIVEGIGTFFKIVEWALHWLPKGYTYPKELFEIIWERLVRKKSGCMSATSYKANIYLQIAAESQHCWPFFEAGGNWWLKVDHLQQYKTEKLVVRER